MKNSHIIQKAINDRIKGLSYREISHKYQVSKSTTYLWLKEIEVSDNGKKRIKEISRLGMERGAQKNREKATKKFFEIEKNCKVLEKANSTKEELKIYLSLLYWGEGAKTGRRLMFINSDPEMIKSYLFLLRKSFPIDESKFRAVLHLHEYHIEEDLKRYWSKLTGINEDCISIYKKANTGKKIKEDYKGCISVRYGDSKILDEIFIIVERFKKIYK